MKSLTCFTAVPYLAEADTTISTSGKGGANVVTLLTTSNEKNFLFIRLDSLRSIVEQKSSMSLMAKNGLGRRLVSALDIQQKYRPWIIDRLALDSYDLFLSYRWNKYDHRQSLIV